MSLARRNFIKTLAIGTAATLTGMKLKSFEKLTDSLGESDALPVLFIGHGNPMNAIEDNYYTNEWKKIRQGLPLPKAILCISAHWLTKGSFVTMAEKPRTIHDMYGFPKELYEVQYNAPGAPEFATLTMETGGETKIQPDHEWGLDHGTWSVLHQMYPEATIPTFQLSIDYNQPPEYHYKLGQQLRSLRKKGILIIGSGNIVHNLRMMRMEEKAYDWAIEFDEKIKTLVDSRNNTGIVNYQDLGNAARLSVPTPDHYYPLLYTLGLSDNKDEIAHFAAKTTMGSVSMRSLKFG